MLAYMQVKAVIAEQIMQHAVDNISQQVASYVYIIDRAGLVLQHSDDELQNTNGLITTTTKNFNDMSGLISKIFLPARSTAAPPRIYRRRFLRSSTEL